VETFLETVHPDVVWISSGMFPDLQSTYSGHDGIREFWRAFLEPWETLEIEVEELHELPPDSVLVLMRFHARGRQGMEVDLRFINHLLFREGKLVRFRSWAEWDDAISELGIEDPRGD
jgi:ketosteroid isomerase-like protein